jgi:hypothetical protein
VRRASRALCGASSAALLLLPSLTASAADPSKPSAARNTSTVAGNAEQSVPVPSAAEAAFTRAGDQYAKGDLVAAHASMAESYRLSQRPELLYNLAMLERELGQCPQALDHYDKYLQLVPQGRYREAASDARAELSLECPTKSTPIPAAPTLPPAPAPTVATVATADQPSPAPEASYWTVPRVAGWSAIAVGALAGGGTLYFTMAAVSARNDYQRSVDAQVRGGPMRDMSLEARQHRDQNVARVLAVSGSALLAGGVLLLVLSPSTHEDRTAAIHIEPGSVQACFTQRF